MSQKIRKAVFPAAGLGSRFLPATKAMPKEMLPIVDKPVIQYLVEEAVASGIEEIIIITGRGKRAIEDHFDHSFELTHILEEKGQDEILKKVQAIEELAKFVYVRQAKPLGDGHAILCAKEVVGNEPFAVLFGDEIIDHETPGLKQLIDAFEEKSSSILGVQEMEQKDIHRYGVIDPLDTIHALMQICALVEKPRAEEAPSLHGLIGKYVCTPDIFTHLEAVNKGPNEELRLIDGFKSMLESGTALFAKSIIGRRFDTGNHWGWLEANLAYAMKNPELKEKLEAFFKMGSSL